MAKKAISPETAVNEIWKGIAKDLGMFTPTGKVVSRKKRQRMLKDKLTPEGYAAMSAIVDTVAGLQGKYAEAIEQLPKKTSRRQTYKIPKGSTATITIETVA